MTEPLKTDAHRSELILRLRWLTQRCRMEAFAECSLAEAVEGAMREAAAMLERKDFKWDEGP